MRNRDYWQMRFRQLEDARHKTDLSTILKLETQYQQAQQEIEGQISTWYQRFADNNGITMAEARQWMQGKDLQEFKWTVQQYIDYGRENALNGQWMKELENASAKFHISKLEALQIQTQQSLEKLFGNQADMIDRAMGRAYTGAYYRTAYELQKGFNVGFNVPGIDQKQLDKVLVKPWAADGFNFSERIWNNKNKLISELHGELSRNILTGQDPQKAINSLAKKMGASKSNAARLIQTEQAYFSSAAQAECFSDLGVEEYEIVATLDSRTSDICRNLDGQHFPMKDYEAGVTAPPFHVNCRSTTVPYFPDNFGQIGERAARDADGKTYYVPDDLKYSDWKAAFVDGNAEGFEEIQENHFHHEQKPDTIKVGNIDVTANTTKLKKAMDEADYKAYISQINNHVNSSIPELYQKYADGVAAVHYRAGNGYYSPGSNEVVFSYPEQRYQDNGRGKYSTLAHEYGHYFDKMAQFDGLTFNELDTIYQNTTYGKSFFKKVASSSDEFLAAVRKDREKLRYSLTSTVSDKLAQNDGSHGVQDAIDGLFGIRIRWGHGDRYYNRKYATVKSMKDHNGLKAAYEQLGMDMKNQKKVQSECRIYEAASEMWANIMSAEVNGGAELEAVKEYLPNSYEALVKILKGVK